MGEGFVKVKELSLALYGHERDFWLSRDVFADIGRLTAGMVPETQKARRGDGLSG